MGKNAFGRIIGIIFFICAGAAFLDWKEAPKGCEYSSLNDKPYVNDFVGRKIFLPVTLITSCNPRDAYMDYPASIVLDATLPKFKPSGTVYTTEDGIRIVVSGSSDISDPHDFKPANPEQQLNNILKRVNRKSHRPIYSKGNEMVYGMERYISDGSVPIYSGDIYVLRNEGSIQIIAECFDDKDKNHRSFQCEVLGKDIYPNVGYHYYFDKKYLPQVRKIDEEITKLIYGTPN